MDDDANKTYSTMLCKRPNMTLQLALSEREILTSSLFLSVIIFIGSLANPIMVVCICRVWSSNSSMCRHLLHLAIGDMIRVFFCLPTRVAVYFQPITFESKNILLLQIRIFLDIFTEILQLLILLLISSDRYYAVAKPFKKYSEQRLNSFFMLVCSWALAILAASCASHFYEDYITMTVMQEMKIHFSVFMLLFLVFESSTVVGILQFYLRTIYFLCKQRKKMQTLSQKKVHPFTTHSEVKEKSDMQPQKILTKSITEEEKKMTNNVVHPRVLDFALPDLKYPETKTPQNERQTEIKVDSDLSKGLSDSANILPTSLVLAPLNLSTDVNESATKWKPQQEKSGTFVTDFKRTEKEDPQMDIAADTTEVLENSQGGDGTHKLGIVLNCTLDGIATKTDIVDDKNSSIINPNKEQTSFRRDNVMGETKVKTAVNLEAGVVDESAENETPWEKSQFSSGNDWDSTQGTIGTERLFVISQQVKFSVKSVRTLSVDLKDDVNRPSSCSTFKDKNESGLQLEKSFVIPTDDNKEEAIKSNNLPNIGTEAPVQTKADEQRENKKATLTGKPEKRDRNAGVKFSDNNLPPTANRFTSLKNKVGQTFQVTTKQETTINVAGPFCLMPNRSKQRFHKEARITRRIAILIIILIVCWMPLYVIRFLQITFLQSGRDCFYKHYKVLWWESLSASTSAFNPCLYGVLNTQLRNEFCRMMRHFRHLLMNCRCWSKCKHFF